MASSIPSSSSSPSPWFRLLTPFRALWSCRRANHNSPASDPIPSGHSALRPATPASHAPTETDSTFAPSSTFAGSTDNLIHYGSTLPKGGHVAVSWLPLPSYDLFQEVPKVTIKTFLPEWGAGDLLTAPPESSEGLELVALTHAKWWWAEYQHEFLLLQVLNTRTGLTLHLVAERDIDKSRAISTTVGRAEDTLSIISEEDLNKNCKNIITVSRAVWHRARPPLHEVIALLFLTSQLHPDYAAFGSNCYYFAAVGHLAIEEYHSNYQPLQEGPLSKSFKGSRWCSLQIISPPSVYRDVLRVVILFYERYAARDVDVKGKGHRPF